VNFALKPITDSFDPLARLSRLLADIRARRESFMAQRQMPADIIAEFKAIGIYRALVAKTLGGDECSPARFCELIETISRADGSAGWVASFGCSTVYLAGLPEPTLRALYANGPDVVFAGGLYPLQPAASTPEGFHVAGRWKFASGCTGAELIGVGISVAGQQSGGLPRVAVMPADQVRIEPNWDVIGLLGTGSHDVVVEDVVVPEEWTFIRGGRTSAIDAPTYRYPKMALAAQVLAVVGLGIARSALDDFVAIAGAQPSITGAPKMADRAYVQLELAKAEAMLRSARAFFYDETDVVWNKVLAGDEVSLKSTTVLRLAITHAARTSAEVARMVCALAGTGAIYNGHALSRAMCDSLVVAQHAFLSEGTLESAGRAFLGLPTPPGFP
jgi:alkylation response protein AidB-like acyl-CoA dehydrogenase